MVWIGSFGKRASVCQYIFFAGVKFFASVCAECHSCHCRLPGDNGHRAFETKATIYLSPAEQLLFGHIQNTFVCGVCCVCVVNVCACERVCVYVCM